MISLNQGVSAKFYPIRFWQLKCSRKHAFFQKKRGLVKREMRPNIVSEVRPPKICFHSAHVLLLQNAHAQSYVNLRICIRIWCRCNYNEVHDVNSQLNTHSLIFKSKAGSRVSDFDVRWELVYFLL